MQKSEDYKFYSFDEENSILYHEITKENCSDIESFIYSMSFFISLIAKYQPINIIACINTEPQNYDAMLNDVMKNIASRVIMSSGVKKIAFNFSNQKFVDLFNGKEINQPTKVKIFSNLEKAKEWVMLID